MGLKEADGGSLNKDLRTTALSFLVRLIEHFSGKIGENETLIIGRKLCKL